MDDASHRRKFNEHEPQATFWRITKNGSSAVMHVAEANENQASADQMLAEAYRGLEFDQGRLWKVEPRSAQRQINLEDWIELGDWKELADKVGAESIFFVDRDPVVVFAKEENADESAQRELYKRIWCMSRPQLLFLATPGQLSVFDLTKPPPKSDEDIGDDERLIAVANSINEVQSTLKDYYCKRVETGTVFGDERFSNSMNRADHALIRDLRTVKQQLEAVTAKKVSSKIKYLHSLIGRTIFIRYLEDRKIISPDYFKKVALKRKKWMSILEQPPQAPGIEKRLGELRFLRVLQNKDFTYALFEQLAQDFNGDMFPVDDTERDFIKQEHLDKLTGFLTGSTSGQRELFFFAYRFDIIPIELISTIYEEFYNERTDKDKNQGSYYTPPALVEFVLAHTLKPEVLDDDPRVIDPACGSGIFLVESFRRMVRHKQAKQKGKRLSRPQLLKILHKQIAGIDINEEAVRVAAFSLYLAFLHYQEPREINDERRLPYLQYQPERQQDSKTKSGAKFLNVLLNENSFDVIDGRFSPEITKRFGPESASVVVGNPPWGALGRNDPLGQEIMATMTEWCGDEKGRPVGDKELSQAFIHLARELMEEGGRAGLLVSSGVLFKRHANSQKFRRAWLDSIRLEHVVNFAHVRRVFFSGTQRRTGATAPFISVVFEKVTPSQTANDRFQYWSARRTAIIENTRSVILSRGDMHWLSQRDCRDYEKLWKIYWWGGHRDEVLVRRLDMYSKLSDLPEQIKGITLESGRGFETSGTSLILSGQLKDYQLLPTGHLQRYGRQLLDGLCNVPDKVYRKGKMELYSGRRLLVARGIPTGGLIKARFETQKFCFQNSIHGIRFKGLKGWQEDIITAVFWSSLARYYYFVTSGSWGAWHDEILLEDVGNMPIQHQANTEVCRRIESIVKKLRNVDPVQLLDNQSRLKELEQKLDEAVFDLYEMSTA
ncbi:MAG: HsdM family class I SAM-dependent methyltransferase, partial [Pseudomonadales bacterium]